MDDGLLKTIVFALLLVAGYVYVKMKARRGAKNTVYGVRPKKEEQ
jgi:hypothetical protein